MYFENIKQFHNFSQTVWNDLNTINEGEVKPVSRSYLAKPHFKIIFSVFYLVSVLLQLLNSFRLISFLPVFLVLWKFQMKQKTN